MWVLGQKFYRRSPDEVAVCLLGKLLVHEADGVRLSGRIVETEAYFAEGDPACHASRGPTPRTKTMFGPPGHAYVYFCYGNHWLLNAVTEPEGVASAVLIRAIEPVDGIETMRARRQVAREYNMTNGPAKLCAALGIAGEYDGHLLWEAPLTIVDDGTPTPRYVRGRRIGIREGAEIEARYFAVDSEYVSR
jgi:DNA-3-methyladenine glycosylase